MARFNTQKRESLLFPIKLEFIVGASHLSKIVFATYGNFCNRCLRWEPQLWNKFTKRTKKKSEIILSLRFHPTHHRIRESCDKFSYDNFIFKMFQSILESSPIRKKSVTKVYKR